MIQATRFLLLLLFTDVNWKRVAWITLAFYIFWTGGPFGDTDVGF